MAFASWENAFWAAGFVGHLGLLCVLAKRHQWVHYPTFALLISYQTVRSVVLFIAARLAGETVYNRAYLLLAFGDYLLQVGLVVEMARSVLRSRGTWLHHTKALFVSWSCVGASIAASLCIAARPLSTSTGAIWEARADLFTTILTAELFLSLLFVANHLRLLWKSRVMAIGGGLGVWCIASFAGDAASALFPSHRMEAVTDIIIMVVYLGVLVFWIVFFSFPKWDDSPSPSDFENFVRLLEHGLGIL